MFQLDKVSVPEEQTAAEWESRKVLSALPPGLTPGRGMRPRNPDSRTPEAVRDMAQRLAAAEESDLSKTLDLVAVAAEATPDTTAAVTRTSSNLDGITLVRIPLPGTADVLSEHGLRAGRDTSDDAGNLAILMVRHEDAWYWNPFGW
jgi:hypothetical protein